ncbi:MAG: histidine triad nucleotide-binding protein [SAR202 cluster bacterium]|nr:histidine triad nucleotide-binding protein [SAR202 cluster bacterium]
MAEQCIFCKIRDGQVKSNILHRDDTCFVIRDIAPKAPVHLLVIPNEHFTVLTSLTPGHAKMLGGMFIAAQQMAVREGVDKAGYRLVINQGDHAGQQVPHLHLHVLGGRQLTAMG